MMKTVRQPRQNLPLIFRIIQFMIGRNGPDTLGSFIFFLFFGAFITGIFVHHFSLYIIEGVLLFLFTFRFFSKNLERRRRENACFSAVWGAILGFIFKYTFRLFFLFLRWLFIGLFTVSRCPGCGRRLPRRLRGKCEFTCPKCYQFFSIWP